MSVVEREGWKRHAGDGRPPYRADLWCRLGANSGLGWSTEAERGGEAMSHELSPSLCSSLTSLHPSRNTAPCALTFKNQEDT
ncbi:hypothetical protein J4Q44_G00277200 [Coregonus suidteri]|uniref:Uncharacterized protein n=1 Tax=Coregonus suidteri TaxID=861788 RepID=A0AAN8KZ84_9TELE